MQALVEQRRQRKSARVSEGGQEDGEGRQTNPATMVNPSDVSPSASEKDQSRPPAMGPMTLAADTVD